jgi:hypothetical protein
MGALHFTGRQCAVVDFYTDPVEIRWNRDR